MRAFAGAGFALALLAIPACQTAQPPPLTEVEQYTTMTEVALVIAAQQTAWNSGDIAGFMDGYWRSEDLRFASGGTITRGWQATLDRYNARYSDRAIMGELVFSDLETQVLSDDAAIVHGRWQLNRHSDTPWGLFTLVFRKFDDEWKITSDTTTSGG